MILLVLVLNASFVRSYSGTSSSFTSAVSSSYMFRKVSVYRFPIPYLQWINHLLHIYVYNELKVSDIWISFFLFIAPDYLSRLFSIKITFEEYYLYSLLQLVLFWFVSSSREFFHTNKISTLLWHVFSYIRFIHNLSKKSITLKEILLWINRRLQTLCSFCRVA